MCRRHEDRQLIPRCSDDKVMMCRWLFPTLWAVSHTTVEVSPSLVQPWFSESCGIFFAHYQPVESLPVYPSYFLLTEHQQPPKRSASPCCTQQVCELIAFRSMQTKRKIRPLQYDHCNSTAWTGRSTWIQWRRENVGWGSGATESNCWSSSDLNGGSRINSSRWTLDACGTSTFHNMELSTILEKSDAERLQSDDESSAKTIEKQLL